MSYAEKVTGTKVRVQENGDHFNFYNEEEIAKFVGTRFEVLSYKWFIRYKILRLEAAIQVEVVVNWESRYEFADTVDLVITVNANDQSISEKFDVKKVKTQNFLFDITKLGIQSDKDIKVTGNIEVSNIKYCYDFIGTVNILTAESRPHDVVLIVGDMKFYVHKTYLASKYFDTMFHGEFAEKNKREIKLDDVDPEELLTLLNIIYPDLKSSIDDDNVLYLLTLADRFAMPSVMAMCGSYLKDFDNCPKVSLMDRLELSEQYNLVHLEIACLSKCHQMSGADFKAFHENNRERIKQLSHSTLKNLI